MQNSPSRLLFPLLLAVASGAAAAQAQPAAEEIGVGVELVLAVDISRSIDPSEQLIQRQGYAAAFRSAEIQEAILYGGWGRVAVTYVEWAGDWSQTVAIPWTLIDSTEASKAFAVRIEAGSSGRVSRTSISGAIDFAADLFEDNGYSGMRRVIDISGDGPNNQGRIVTEARDAAVARGITINGLPLLTSAVGDPWGSWGSIPDLDRYYQDYVIGGSGAFVIPVTSWDQFAAAVRQKLVMELAGLQLPAREQLIRVQAVPASDCLVGERLWEQRQRNWGD